MLDILILLSSGLLAGFRSRLALQTEILALRYQIIFLMRSANRTKLQAWDRFVWIGLLRFWPQWRSVLIIVKSEAALAWHRKGFRLLWTWKCRHGKSGRPKIPREVRDLIPTMSKNNLLWGAPRIHGELLKLGINVSQATVAKYMTHHPKLPSQTWRTFLINHSKQLASIDFFTVPTISFRVLRKTPQLRDKYTDVLAKLLSMTFLSTLFGGFYLILESPASARYSPKQREIRSNEVFDNDKSQCGPFGTSTHDGHSTLFQKLELGVRIIQNSDIKEIEKAPTDLSLQPLIGLNVNESNFFVAKSHGCISI